MNTVIKRVWIENPFDGLPLEGHRPLRYWLMSEAFAAAGYEVTYFTSDFNHATKAPRKIEGRPKNFDLVTIPTPRYRKNVSLKRLLSHGTYAKNWLKAAREYAKNHGMPDLLIVSAPPLSTGPIALQLKREFDCRLVVDVMDLWPETFYRVVPKIAQLFLLPLHAKAADLYKGADLVTGVCRTYEDRIREYGAKEYLSFYHGVTFAAEIPAPRSGLSFVYAGSLGRGYNLAPAIDAVKNTPDATLDIAGSGEREAEWKKLAADSLLSDAPGQATPRIRFHGQLDAEKLDELLRHASIGIIPLSDDTLVGLPYKLGDYARNGLKVISSLRGECAAFLEENKLGTVYDPESPASFIEAAMKALKLEPRYDAIRGAFAADRIYRDYVNAVTA